MKSIRFWLRRSRWYRTFHLAYVGWRARYIGLPNWKSLLGFQCLKNLRDNSVEGVDRVLIATGAAGHIPSMTLESLLGVALSARGVVSDFLLCDATLPACMMCEVNWYSDVVAFSEAGPKDRCKTCLDPSAHMLGELGFQNLGLSTQLNKDEREFSRHISITLPLQKIADYRIDDISIGEHAMAGTLRFFARGDLDNEPDAESVLRRYFEAALLTYHASHRLFSEGVYKVAVLNHGIYVPQGVIAATARKLGIRVVTWHPAYRRGCFIFNHDETYHHGLIKEPISLWENMKWKKSCRDQIEQYLKSRWVGKNDWVKFHLKPEFSIAAIQKETGINFSLPTIGLLTNVVWDAQLHYKDNAFNSMLDWLVKTIEYFSKRPDLQLLIRIHPAELTGTLPTRQPVMAEIMREFPSLPHNVYIIPPESRLSTYAAMAQCNAALIYGTKMGVELSASGIPVIVAGEAWIRGKGVTSDANSEKEYFQFLDELPHSTAFDEQKRDRALRYAFHFFFRRMIPLDFVKERIGRPFFKLKLNGFGDLVPGKSPGLDIICDGILFGTPFIYPAEDDATPSQDSLE